MDHFLPVRHLVDHLRRMQDNTTLHHRIERIPGLTYPLGGGKAFHRQETDLQDHLIQLPSRLFADH